MPLPILPLLLAGGAAIAALALGGKKDEAPGGAGPNLGKPNPLTPTVPNPFDKGLSAQQIVAIQTALASEQDPDKLDAFAKSLLPEFPMAAAALTSRAIALRVARAANAPPPPAPPLPVPPAGVIFPPVVPSPVPLPPVFVSPVPVAPAVLPMPAVAATFPCSATITTHDTGPSGDLIVRATPDPNGAPMGANHHGDTVTVLGPAIGGFYPLATGGFSSAQYITLGAPVSLASLANVITPPVGGFPQTATVTTHDTGPTGNLTVRATPDTNGAPVGTNAHGATVLVTGPAMNGFYPVAGPGGVGFSSATYLTLGGPVQVPSAPVAPFGGLVQPASFQGVSFPSFPNVGSQAIVATHDTGASGTLAVRSSAPSGAVIGSNPHGGVVTITGPLTNGFYPIASPGGTGYSSASYLAAAPTPTVSAGASGLGPVGTRIEVTANLLGLRGAPDARAPYIAQASRGSTFTIAGPARGNYYPLRDDAGAVAWASALYIAPVASVAAGQAQDTGAGPSIPVAELHTTALALKTALAVHGCRSYNEPIVKDFQRVAKLAGIYTGDIDGWYGTVTQAALSKIVGKPAPACFASAKGGPVNPNEYWSPMGV